MADVHRENQDPSNERALQELLAAEQIRQKRLPGVRTVLVVLSTTAMVYDRDALLQCVIQSYPEAAVFFSSTSGKPIGLAPPQRVDLLVDLTGPGQRQSLLMPIWLRRAGRHVIGRVTGVLRKLIYDRVFDEREIAAKPELDRFDRERLIQKEVLALAGIPLPRTGEVGQDRGSTIALELPVVSS